MKNDLFTEMRNYKLIRQRRFLFGSVMAGSFLIKRDAVRFSAPLFSQLNLEKVALR